jgi:hypothetical protein
MVRVNGKKFKIYELDNLSSFKSRLADIMSTEESFLYFPNGITVEEIHNKKSNIIVDDLLSEIKNSAKKNSSVVTLVKNIQIKVGKNKYERGKDIVNLWLAYNKKLEKDVEQQGKNPLDVIGNELEKNKIFISSRQIHTAWIQTNNVKKFIEMKITNNSNKVTQTLKIFKEYDSVEDSVAYTELHVEEIHFVLILNLYNISLMEMFNAIQLNDMVPYATTNQFYKILQDFIPPDEWSTSLDNTLMLRVYQKDYMSISGNTANYGKAEVQVNPLNQEVTSNIVIKNEKNNISRDDFTDRSLTVFKQLDIKVNKISESKVVGVFFLPALQFNKYVFSDLVLNDKLFSKLIKIDDSKKATKMKTGIYIHFYHPTTGHIKATLTEKIMIKGDSTMKNVDLEMFETGVPYIRIKIKNAPNTQSAEMFQEIIGKLFIIYENKKDTIIEYYKNYIQNFGDIAPPEEEEEEILVPKKIAPDLFAAGYTISCNPYRMPTIVSEEAALKSKQSYMKFPRDRPDDLESLKFPRDGENQHYYICNNPAYPHPGLKDNNLENSDIYPYVPCCFKKDQSKKPKYLHYYEGKGISSTEKKQNNIITTDKSLKYNQFGTLPENITRLFTIIDPNPDYEYVRKGVYDNKNSFINVVMEALNDETNILDIDEENDRNNVLIEERMALATKPNAALCRQEMYDATTDEIINLIKNTDKYFDPKLFLHILEDKFDCNIFLFTKKFAGGEMTLPRHVQAYYKNRNKKRCIYVYEHMRNEYPQCELIVKYNTTKTQNNSQYSFTYQEARNVRNVFTRLRKSYALNVAINETYFPLNNTIKIKSQWIDSYGKSRRFNVIYKNKQISMITSPMQPLKVRETTTKDIELIDIKTVMNFANDINMQVQSQTVIGNTVKEINGVIGNVNVSIPVIETEKIQGIPEQQHGLSFPEKHVSSLDKYNTNKKIARYLVEYTLWMYSNYLNDNGIISITDNNISQFAKEFFSIKPNYKYGKINKTFNNQSPLLESGKIVVHNEETIKRLIYVLRLNVQNNIDSVMMYYKNKVIKNYYVDITDFDTYHGQSILYGEESIEKWISENNMFYNTNKEIQVGVNTPYFFKNSLIDNNMYLAQNTQTLEKAIDIAVSWVRSGNNVGVYAENMKPVEFTLYSYVNGNNIKPARKINGKAFSEEIKIIGYKIDNDPKYTVLLSLV